MDIPNHAELLTLIETFCLRHDMAETRFGRDAVSNPNFIRGLRDGVSPTLDTLTKVGDFMAEKDAAAALRAKLSVEPPPIEEGGEEQLPFSQAPVKATGASLPTSSKTPARPPRSEANGSSRCSTAGADGHGPPHQTSCSGADA